MASQVLNLVIKAQDKASGKIRDVNKSMKKMGGASQGLGAKLGGLKTGLLGVTAALAGIGLATKKVINLAAQQEQAEVRLAAVVKATGGAAGLSAQELFKMASAFQTATGMGDELVMEGQAILLTFKNIREEAFERTMTVALDMAAVLGTDLKGSAMQLGKALNDPKTGLSMLTRVGITFTEKQKEVILALQATGDMAGAQGVILEELESQMGGAAEAMGDTLAGSMQKASGAMGDLGEQIGFVLSPAVRELSERIVILAENTGTAVPKFAGLLTAQSLLKEAVDKGTVSRREYNKILLETRGRIGDAADILAFLEQAEIDTAREASGLTEKLDNASGSMHSFQTVIFTAKEPVEELAKATGWLKINMEKFAETTDKATISAGFISRMLKNDLAVVTGTTTRQIILFEEEMAEIKETMIKTGIVSGDLRQRYSDLGQEVQRLTGLHNLALMPMRELIVLDAQMAAGADRTKLMKAGLIPTVAGLTHEYEKEAGAIENIPLEEYTNDIGASTGATLILTGATSGSNRTIAASSGIMDSAANSMSSYASSVNSTATAENNLAQSIRERLAAQGAAIAPGMGIVSAGGDLRAAKVGDEWEEVHGEWQSGAGGQTQKQHIQKVIDDMEQRHGFDPANPQDWGLEFLASQVSSGLGTQFESGKVAEVLKANALGAHGLSGIVPGGYPNDSFMIGATSGESVNITPAHMRGGGGGMVINTVNVYGVQTSSQLFDAVTQAARQRGRDFAKVM